MTPMRSSSPHDHLDRDPQRDAALAAELRRHDAVDANTDALRASIVARARERLARLEGGDEWWVWTARWSHAAIPIAAAAAIAGVTIATMLALPTEEPTALRAPVVAFATVASPAETGTQLMDSLVGPATHDWVLNGAVSR
jgi:hypothetical protein